MSSEAPRRAAAPCPSSSPASYRVIAADHPSLAGHFPDHPIVPGVVILEEVVQAFGEWRPESRVVGMPVVKFLAPLRPGQTFAIRFAESGARGIRFECVRDGGQPLAQGCLTLIRVGERLTAS